MRSFSVVSLLALLMAVPACRCGATEPAPAGPEQAEEGSAEAAPVPERVIPPGGDPPPLRTDEANIVIMYNALGGDLFEVLAEEPGNLLISPTSIAAAMHMLLPGATGESRVELNVALSVRMMDYLLFPMSGELLQQLAESPSVSIADRVFVDGSVEEQIVPAYRELLERHFAAPLSVLDFRNAPEESRRHINEWVAGQTNDHIESLLDEGMIDAMTRLVLTNAVHFDADWETPFDPELTQPGTFETPDGPVEVPFMRRVGEMQYLNMEDGAAVVLPYGDGTYSMVFLLPESTVNDDFYTYIEGPLIAPIDGSMVRNVELVVPKFRFGWGGSLVEPFRALGVERSFGAEAEFDGIVPDGELYISEIAHDAYIEVDEVGTEAAAATAVVVGRRGIAPTPIEMRFDRPFYFGVVHNERGALLFIGRVEDPTQE